LYLGLSRSSWYRLLTRENAPAAIKLAGAPRFWRVKDLDSWLKRLKPSRRRKARPTENNVSQETVPEPAAGRSVTPPSR
jgi:predicted DNA-binding transcriptional regulator AlpA